MSLVATSVNGFAGGSPAAKPPFPHISDLTSVTAGVDPHSPIRKLLDDAHACLRQADTFNSFGRPDAALSEYIRGSLIAVEVVPRHKQYPSLRTDREGLWRLYEALMHKVQAASAAFEGVKEEIKADNARSGVLPRKLAAQRDGYVEAGPGANRGAVEANTAAPDRPAESDTRSPTTSPSRAKPVVHPKPQSLHGNSIKHGSSASRSSIDTAMKHGSPIDTSTKRGSSARRSPIDTKDLTARFASLGGPASPPKQDPRIRTQAIVP
ncbi:hypothetical protein IMZ48_46705, partial [Candidatus Bathyarchaeota archaeon]|nr:hypothetical protein [Candidatus Bathyarchaeota archaeon]